MISMIRFRLSTRLLSLIVLPCLFALIGCGGEPKLGQVPAKATVKVDGVTIEGAAVIFVDTAGNSGSGLTGKDGIAVMKSSISKDGKMIEVNGILPGEYKVGINKSESKQIPDPDNPNFVKVESVNNIVPVKYNSYLRSGLTATVKQEGPNEFLFELSK